MATSGPTALARFLTDVRAGHCEYFATAATLMLREAGIPARYATGYAVMERDPKRGEYLIRGTHGHAWCRVWDETTATWIDFDPTPPDWFAQRPNTSTVIQRFNDGLKRIREDFFIWRNRPANRFAVSSIMLGVAFAVTAFVIKRLWRTKRRSKPEIQAGDYAGPVIRTPLHRIETQARKHLGHRPPGETFAEWLARLRPSLPDATLSTKPSSCISSSASIPARHPPACEIAWPNSPASLNPPSSAANLPSLHGPSLTSVPSGISNVLNREASPFSNNTFDFGRPSVFARKSLSSAFAFPSTAGAPTRTRNTRPACGSSSQPMTSLLRAFGVARTRSFMTAIHSNPRIATRSLAFPAKFFRQ